MACVDQPHREPRAKWVKVISKLIIVESYSKAKVPETKKLENRK